MIGWLATRVVVVVLVVVEVVAVMLVVLELETLVEELVLVAPLVVVVVPGASPPPWPHPAISIVHRAKKLIKHIIFVFIYYPLIELDFSTSTILNQPGLLFIA